jgi:DNA-binding IclR family transcriptional regulator
MLANLSNGNERCAEMLKKTLPSSQRRQPKWVGAGSTAKGPNSDPYRLRSILRALDVLEAFDDKRPVLSLKDLSNSIGLPAASLFRILLTLQSRGYLLQNEDGTYQLTRKVLLGRLSERADKFHAMAKPELRALAAHFNETASLAYLLDDHIQVIDSIDSLHEMRISNRPGRVLPPHCSAMGKAITAFQTREQVDRILEAYGLAPRTSHSIVDRRDFVSHLIQVRETGVAYDREESTLGGICIAAAIQMPDGRAVAAVSVSTPVSRMTAEREPETAAGVLNAAQRIAKLATQEE